MKTISMKSLNHEPNQIDDGYGSRRKIPTTKWIPVINLNEESQSNDYPKMLINFGNSVKKLLNIQLNEESQSQLASIYYNN